MKPAGYIPGLNGLRAIAAMIVVIFHTDQFSHYFGLISYGIYKTRMQSYAVILFFVLSGFLITLLLMKEKAGNGKINIRRFYMRRILRTWPVYYLVLITGLILLFSMPGLTDQRIKHNLCITSAAYFFLIPNIASYFGYAPNLINVLWSVGAEEQLYAIWPFLIQSARKLLHRFVWLLFAYLLLKYIFIWMHLPYWSYRLMSYIPFDCMLTGGIAACIYRNRMNKILSVIYHPVVQGLAWFFFFGSIFYRPLHVPALGMLNYNLHAVVYAVIILNVGTNAKTMISLENRLLNFLGKISYGIYGFHFIVLYLLSLALKTVLAGFKSSTAHIIMFASVVIATVIVAYLSWTFYESWFLRKKKYYSAR